MKLLVLSSNSGVLKLIRSRLTFLFISVTEERLAQGAQRDYYGKGSPLLFKVLAENLIYFFPNSEK